MDGGRRPHGSSIEAKKATRCFSGGIIEW